MWPRQSWTPNQMCPECWPSLHHARACICHKFILAPTEGWVVFLVPVAPACSAYKYFWGGTQPRLGLWEESGVWARGGAGVCPQADGVGVPVWGSRGLGRTCISGRWFKGLGVMTVQLPALPLRSCAIWACELNSQGLHFLICKMG